MARHTPAATTPILTTAFAAVTVFSLAATRAAGQPPGTAGRVDAAGDPLPDGALLRIGTHWFRDGGASNQAVVSPDGRLVVTGSESGITVFEIPSGRRALHLSDCGVPNGYGPNNAAFAFAPDGKTLYTLSGAGDGPGVVPNAARVADAEGRPLRDLGHKARPGVLGFSPDGAVVAAATEAGDARVWDVASGKTLADIAVPVTPGRRGSAVTPGSAAAGGPDALRPGRPSVPSRAGSSDPSPEVQRGLRLRPHGWGGSGSRRRLEQGHLDPAARQPARLRHSDQVNRLRLDGVPARLAAEQTEPAFGDELERRSERVHGGTRSVGKAGRDRRRGGDTLVCRRAGSELQEPVPDKVHEDGAGCQSRGDAGNERGLRGCRSDCG